MSAATCFNGMGSFIRWPERKPEILRVPSLRNVATTAPYFHDGSARPSMMPSARWLPPSSILTLD